MEDRGIRRDPLESIRAGGIQLQGLDDVPSLVAVDLIEAAKEISFSVAADHVTGGQDLEETLAVSSLDQILLDR